MVPRNPGAAELYSPPDETAALLALMSMPGVGGSTVASVAALACAVGVPVAELRGLPEARLRGLLPPGAQREACVLAACGPEHARQAATVLRQARAAGISVLTAGSSGYPVRLSQCPAPAPPVLFMLGNTALHGAVSGGVVGTRQPSAQGLALARQCAGLLAAMGCPVVSGAAAGVDLAAHEAVLAAGGSTVAVLPQGLLAFPRPFSFERALRRGNLLLISEFLPWAPWQTHAAVTRNARIAALSAVLCVIEPSKVGGSIRTAQCALQGGIPVFWAGRPGCGVPPLLGQGQAKPMRIAPGELEAQLRLGMACTALSSGKQALLF